MKKYIFEDYRDKVGVGDVKMYDTKKEAVDAAKEYWGCLTASDQQSYKSDPAGMFRVYEIEADPDAIEGIADGSVIADAFWTSDIWDALN